MLTCTTARVAAPADPGLDASGRPAADETGQATATRETAGIRKARMRGNTRRKAQAIEPLGFRVRSACRGWGRSPAGRKEEPMVRSRGAAVAAAVLVAAGTSLGA